MSDSRETGIEVGYRLRLEEYEIATFPRDRAKSRCFRSVFVCALFVFVGFFFWPATLVCPLLMVYAYIEFIAFMIHDLRSTGARRRLQEQAGVMQVLVTVFV